MGLYDRFSGPPTKDKFASLVMAGIRQAGEKRQIIYDPVEFRLSVANEKGRIMFLNNGFAEYCAVPKAVRSKTLHASFGIGLLPRKRFPRNFRTPATIACRPFENELILRWLN